MCILRMLGGQYIAMQAGALPAAKSTARRLLALRAAASSKDRAAPNAYSVQRSIPR